MSSIAINFTNENEILLHSDGGAEHFRTGELLSTNCRKIFKISDRCAIMMVGAFPEFIEAATENFKNTFHSALPPAVIANGVGEALEHFINSRDEDPNRDYLSLIVGFNDLGSAELWRLARVSERGREYGFEGNNPYRPIQLDFKPGDSFAVAAQTPRDQADFNERLIANRKKGFDEKGASTWAFRDFVKSLEKKGVLIGGELFTETLKPPSLVPEVSVNELNAVFDEYNTNINE